MSATCYAMVRGSALRVTGLEPCGSLPESIPYAVSTSVAEVTINEVSESGRSELLRSETDDPRLIFVSSGQTIRYRADIRFLRVDPGIFNLVSGMSLVHSYAGGGFGMAPFGETPFGEGPPEGAVVGFDAKTRVPAKAFALEVWSKIADQSCEGGRKYGYTLFPFMRGGIMSGFQFSNGLVSFTVTGAQTRRGAKWGRGPYDLEGPYRRLETPVSGNLSWRTFLTTAPPPPQHNGIIEIEDFIDNGTAADPGTGFVDNGTASDPGVGAIDGGQAA